MIAEDRLVACVYNPAHHIFESRLQYHLVRCRKTACAERKAICAFDSTHHVDSHELGRHIHTCPNRRVLEEHAYVLDGTRVNDEPYIPPKIPQPEEDWESEADYGTYLPDKCSENKPVLRSLHGATKSERKAFRNMERRRMQALLNNHHN